MSVLKLPEEYESKPFPSTTMILGVILVVALIIVIVYFVTNRNNPTQTTQCTYNNQTYPIGASFKSEDDCNTCSCSYQGVGCTLMACNVSETPQITITYTATPILPTNTIAPIIATTIVSNKPGFKLYFGKPAAANDFTTIESVFRETDTTGIQVFSFILGQLLVGPTAQEKAAGIVSTFTLSGKSNCKGSAFQFDKSGNVFTVKFCKTLGYAANPGNAGTALTGNTRVINTITNSLLVNGVTKVIIRQPDNSCFAKDTGLNQACK